MEIIGKLDKKLEEVDNLIALKKGETNSMSEVSVHCSPLSGSSAIQPFDSRRFRSRHRNRNCRK